MKVLSKFKRTLALSLTVCLLMCCTVVEAKTNAPVEESQINDILKSDKLPANIQSLLSETEKTHNIYLAASEKTNGTYDTAELYTIRTEAPLTNKSTVTIHSTPVKYIDDSGNLQFIDTAVEPVETSKRAQTNYAYRNAANSFTVEYGNTATTGINFDDVFTFAVKGDTSAKSAQAVTKADENKLVYSNAFGENTAVEYINIENGVKENIILSKYTEQTRFDFIFRSETHIPVLDESGKYVLIVNREKPTEPEYRFLSLYAYDSYDPTIHGIAENSTFRHTNDDLYYELASNTDGSYTITVVVPDNYLNHPEIVYPVTIDPSLTPYTSTASNTHDTFVDAGNPNAQTNYNLDYIRFGNVNGYKNFGYHRFVTLPSILNMKRITSAKLKFTFRSGQNTPTSSSGVKMCVLQVENGFWSESTITWNNQPYGTGGPLVDIVYDGNYLSYFEADISDMVESWYQGTMPNYGVDFTYSNEDYNDYNSVVSSNGDAARAPVLSIEYERLDTRLKVGYTIQNAYPDTCTMKNYDGFSNYANGVKGVLGESTTLFSWEGTQSFSNDLKSDYLTNGISYDNIEDVDLMFFIGHGYKKGRTDDNGSTPFKYNSLHFGTTNSSKGHAKDDGDNPVSNFTTADALYFGYGDSRVKWLVTYSCNFLETGDSNVFDMLKNGGRLILGFSSTMVINSNEGKMFAEKLIAGETLQKAFFEAAKEYQESTILHGQKYVSCLYFYDANYPDGTKDDTLTYQASDITRDSFYCLMHNVNS